MNAGPGRLRTVGPVDSSATLPGLGPADNSHDLRQFFRAVGSFGGQRALLSTPEERTDTDVPVDVLDADPVKVTAQAMVPAGFVDGVQASLCVTYRAHRPVFLSYTAAGAVGAGAKPLGLLENLVVVCSAKDREWVEDLGSTIPINELAAESPPDVEREAHQLLGGSREKLERALIEDLDSHGLRPLVVDGNLVARPFSTGLLGVVKSTRRRYLPDERVLFGLRAGWRSPRFRIPAGSNGHANDRYSCYLRLHDASHQAWNFGMVRLETYDADQLDPLAARCLLERQGAASGDARWDRHLASVAAVEEFLRARRPTVYGM